LLLLSCLGAIAVARSALAQCPDGMPPPCRSSQPVARIAVAPPPAPTSVAVLPFQNRSPDSSDAYLAEGMTEEVGNRLTQLGRLQVKARGLVDAQWRRTPDPFDAARRLNVAWFVHGNVRHAGSQLLVNVELVRMTTGEEVWASRFPRRDTDVFAVQAEVAESVAAVVGGRLSPVERATIARRPTRDNEAYRLYLYGNTLVKRRTQADVQGAIDAYTQAVQRDSGFAPAWAALGTARAIYFSWGWDVAIPRDSLLVLARVAARRAVAIDSTLAEAWTADAVVAIWELDFGRAQSSCGRSLQLDSLSADAYHVCAGLYTAEYGLVDGPRAEPLFRRALALDPDLRNSWRLLARSKMADGRLAETEALLDTTLAIASWQPGFQDRSYVRFLRGNGPGALADLAESERLSGTADSLGRALYAIALGDSTAARAALARFRAIADSVPGANFLVARWSAALGMRSEALAALERYRAVVNPREPKCTPTTTCSVSLGTWRLLHDPIFAPLRNEPSFVRLLEETRPRVPWR
jgi:serine/threonine-protein kinase